MAGTKTGALKRKAAGLGMTVQEYTNAVDSGLKHCWKCGQWKPIEEFSHDRTRPDGRTPICRPCQYVPVRDGPTIYERDKKRAEGLAWCSGCERWLPVDKMSRNKCRHCWNRYGRDRYHFDQRVRMERLQHAKARGRNTDPIPVDGQERLQEMFGGRCAYCGAHASTWDHIVPISRGGQTVPWNIVPACVSCNSSKNAMDLFEWADKRGIEFSHQVIDVMCIEYLPHMYI